MRCKVMSQFIVAFGRPSGCFDTFPLWEAAKNILRGECPDFFWGGQSILIKTGGVEMNFTHNGGDNIVSLGLWGKKVYQSNFLNKFHAVRTFYLWFYTYLDF